MKKFSLILVLILITSLSFAETITLTNGDVIEGVIVERTDDFITMNTGAGVDTTCYLNEIEKIAEEEAALKEVKKNIVDCGNDIEVIKFRSKLQALENNTTLACLGRNILNGCSVAHGIINMYNTGTVKYELLGGSDEQCKIRIEFDEIPEQTVSTNIDYAMYSGTDFQCDVSVGFLKKIWANSDFNGELEKITPGFVAYNLYKYAFSIVTSSGASCSGSAVEKTDYSVDEGLLEIVRELEEEAEQEKVKKDIERKNNPGNVEHCGAINNTHIFSLPEKMTDDEKDAVSCFNENLLNCYPVTFDIVGSNGRSFEIKTKQGDFCLINDGNQTCKIPADFILEASEALKAEEKSELLFLSIAMGMSFGKVTNMDTKETIIIECD